MSQPADPDKLLAILGHRFHDADMLNRALRHASTVEDRVRSNERLEFLGDRVLGLVVAEILYGRYPDEEEGELARRFAGLTSREALVRVADAIGLERFIRSQAGDAETRARSQASVSADTMEAILGALYLDGGLKPAGDFIRRHWESLIEEDLAPPKDAKTALQEWTQARGLGLPTYEMIKREGPDHAPVFTVRVRVKDQGQAQGEGNSRRSAEQAAAAHLLTELEERP